ncbi:hypothetical protein JCM9279_004866 [Rhodotorula babjevae]
MRRSAPPAPPAPASPTQPAHPPGDEPSSTRRPAAANSALPPLRTGLPAEAAPRKKEGGKEERKKRVVMLGHWHQRTWDFAAALNATGALECFAAVSDLQDALVVLRAAIEPADVLVCSSYYELGDVQEVLLDYEPVGERELGILVARPNQLNTDGHERVAQWVVDCVQGGLYAPRVKAALLSSSGYMRRLSETSGRSGGSEGT